jgi:hypothetical protein
MRKPFLPLLCAVAALAACKEDPRAAAPGPGRDTRAEAAIQAVDAPLRARLRLPAEAQQRGVQVFAQAMPGTVAVCGRVRDAQASGDAFVPYVAVVNVAAEPQLASLVVGTTGTEAARVFLDMVERCFDGGGPASARVIARAMPPLPTPAAMQAAAQPEPAAIPAVALQPVARTVMTSSTTGANIRSSPQSGAVLRTAPRSTVLEVFGEAPGGWYQVGQDGTAWGWVHRSVLDGPVRMASQWAGEGLRRRAFGREDGCIDAG